MREGLLEMSAMASACLVPRLVTREMRHVSRANICASWSALALDGRQETNLLVRAFEP